MCTVWRKLLESSSFIHTVHIVPRCHAPNPCLPQQQDIVPRVVKSLSLALLKMGKSLPETCWDDQWRSIKLLLLHLVVFYFTLPTLMMHGQTKIKFLHLLCWSLLNRVCPNWIINSGWLQALSVRTTCTSPSVKSGCGSTIQLLNIWSFHRGSVLIWLLFPDDGTTYMSGTLLRHLLSPFSTWCD